jgi:hypothetical protein
MDGLPAGGGDGKGWLDSGLGAHGVERPGDDGLLAMAGVGQLVVELCFEGLMIYTHAAVHDFLLRGAGVAEFADADAVFGFDGRPEDTAGHGASAVEGAGAGVGLKRWTWAVGCRQVGKSIPCGLLGSLSGFQRFWHIWLLRLV